MRRCPGQDTKLPVNKKKKMTLYSIMQDLRDLAENSSNDTIANAAANLAARLESVNTPFGYDIQRLTSVDRDLIRFARSKRVDICS